MLKEEQNNAKKILSRVYINSLKSLNNKINKVDEGRSIYANFSQDQVELLKHSNVVTGNHPTLKDLGITGTEIQNILPKYIYRFRSGGQFG